VVFIACPVYREPKGIIPIAKHIGINEFNTPPLDTNKKRLIP